MQHILTTVRKTLARKEYSNHVIARLALTQLAKFFKKPQLEGYIRYNILYVELEQQSEIILLFSQKTQILTEVNVVLTDYGYDRSITDIRHKKMRSKELSDGYM